MSRIVLHVGLTKTGTTAVQQFLAQNRAQLLEHGVRWTAAMRGPNHVALPAAFTARPNRVTASVGVSDTADQTRVRTRLRERLAREAAEGGTQLVSSEHLTAMLRSPAEIRAVADFLHGIVDDVDVLMVVRRGDHWLPSAYAEAVVGRTSMAFDQRFVRARRTLLDHGRLVRRWRRAFGASSVRVLPFLEADKRDPSAIPLRLLGELDVPSSVAAQWPVPAVVSRAGLGATATEMLRRLTELAPEQGLRPHHDRLRLQAALAQRFPGPPVRLTPVAAAALEARGWIFTGVGAMPQAVGDGWDEWVAQPAAEVGTAPLLEDAEVVALADELRAEGVLPRRALPAAKHARRAAIRVLRR